MLYRHLLRPLLFNLTQEDPETAHDLAVALLEDLGRSPTMRDLLHSFTNRHEGRLGKTVCGIHFPNPIGLAAGFVKKPGHVIHGLEALGFGFIEIGTITPEPQAGNARPRMFRLPADRALINRMGFNNAGAKESANILRSIPKTYIPLGISLGMNKETPLDRAEEDYVKAFDALNKHADYLVVNVSSPNTKGLRDLQDKDGLTRILKALRIRAVEHETGCGEKIRPLFVKLAPDLTEHAVSQALQVCSDHAVNGIIATNTTKDRDGLRTSIDQIGGLSGPPLKERAQNMVRFIRNERPDLALIGVGGISTVDDVRRMQDAGADLIQLYTSFVYEGPRLPMKLSSGLARSALHKSPDIHRGIFCYIASSNGVISF